MNRYLQRAPHRSVMKKLFLIVTAVASLTTSKAITVIKPNCASVEQGAVLGTVTHVNQAQRSFTVRWEPIRRGYHQWNATYEVTVRVTDRTVFEKGSWANVVPGAGIKIKGSGDIVD